MLTNGTREEKVRVVFAAEEIGGSEGLSLLLAALTDAEEEVRGAAVRALESTLTGAVLKAMAARLPREQGGGLAPGGRRSSLTSPKRRKPSGRPPPGPLGSGARSSVKGAVRAPHHEEGGGRNTPLGASGYRRGLTVPRIDQRGRPVRGSPSARSTSSELGGGVPCRATGIATRLP